MAGGRPKGKSCEFLWDPANGGSGCRKTARVRVYMNISGSTHVSVRCWDHYLRMENNLRGAREGMGNIIRSEVIPDGDS